MASKEGDPVNWLHLFFWCVERSLPGRRSGHSAFVGCRCACADCANYIGRPAREGLSCGGLVSTAKTTLLPVYGHPLFGRW